MKLKQGKKAPNFEVTDIHGTKINLHQLSNEKVLLTFFRYAECALCNLRISEIKNESERLKELDIKLIAVFQSSKESLIASIYDKHAFDFTIISDPESKLYNLYGVKPSWIKLLKTTTWKGIKSMLKASSKGYKLGGKVEGKFNQIPADFLLNKDKHIEIAHYGDNLIDHIAIKRIVKTPDSIVSEKKTNKMNTKTLMLLSSFFLGVIGSILTFFPDEIISSIGILPNPISTLSFQLLGALYLGFAILNWMAKGSLIGGIYNKPIVVGNLMHFGVGAFALVKIISEIQVHLEIAISLTAIYAIFAILFVYVFRTNPE